MRSVCRWVMLLVLIASCAYAQNANPNIDKITDANGKADSGLAVSEYKTMMGKPVSLYTSESTQHTQDTSTAIPVLTDPRLQADRAQIDARLSTMSADLNKVLEGYNDPDAMKARLVEVNAARQAADQTRLSSNGAPTPAFYPIGSDFNDGYAYGVDVSAYKSPRPSRTPGQVEVFENVDYAADFNKKANQELDKVENFLEDKLGLGGCGDFAFGAEFTMLFNKEVLQDFLTNLQQGVIAAAPMAILTALSPELANIIQHLKAMAAMALQIAKGDCSMIQGIMTDQLTKAFNGKDWEECMTSANTAGHSQEEGNALCRNKRAVLGDGAASFMGLGIPQMGVALDDFLNNASDSLATGKPYSEVAATRERLTVNGQSQLDDLTNQRAALRVLQQEKDAILNDPANYTPAPVKGLTPAAEALLANKDKTIVYAQKNYEYSTKEVTRTTRTMSPTQTRRCVQDPACLTEVKKNYKEKNGSTATSTFDDFITGASSAYDEIMGSNPVTGFLQEYLKQTVGPLKMQAGLEVGPYNFRFDMKRKAFAELAFAMELEDVLPAMWTAYKNCDDAGYAAAKLRCQVLLYGLLDNPWKQTAGDKSILYRNRATRLANSGNLAYAAFDGELIKNPASEFSDDTLLKMAYAAYRTRFASTAFGKWASMSNITAGGGSTWTGGGSERGDNDGAMAYIQAVAQGKGMRVVVQQLSKASLAYFTLEQMEQDKDLDGKINEIKKEIDRAFDDPAMKDKGERVNTELQERIIEVTKSQLADIAAALPYIVAANAVYLDEKPHCQLEAFMYAPGGAGGGSRTVAPSSYDEFIK